MTPLLFALLLEARLAEVEHAGELEFSVEEATMKRASKKRQLPAGDDGNMSFEAFIFSLIVQSRLAEVRHALPPLIITAICAHESGFRQRLVTREKHGHCSAGAAQVLVRGCDRARVQRLLVLSVNLDAGARILASSRATCRRHPRWGACRRSEWALYNANSSRWWSGVARKWRRLVGRGAES